MLFLLQMGFNEWVSHVGLEPGDAVHVQRVAPTRFVFNRWEAEGGSTSNGGSASMADDSDLADFGGNSGGGGSRGVRSRGICDSEGGSGKGNSGGSSRLPRLAARGAAQPEVPSGGHTQPQQRQPRQRESQQLERVLIKTGPSTFQTAADVVAAGELRRYVSASAAESLHLEVPSVSALYPLPASNNMLLCSTWLATYSL
jgi:hypothetical protein